MKVSGIRGSAPGAASCPAMSRLRPRLEEYVHTYPLGLPVVSFPNIPDNAQPNGLKAYAKRGRAAAVHSAKVLPFSRETAPAKSSRAGRRRKGATYPDEAWREIEQHLWKASRELQAAFDVFCRAKQ